LGPTDRSEPSVDRPAGPSFIPELDAFRAVAILSVMAIHWLPSDSLINRAQEQTTNGVQLFFVLSGFLITRILLQSRLAVDAGTTSVHWSLRQFYARRAVRIFPVYYLALFTGAALAFPGVRHAIWWHVTYLSNAYFAYRRHSLYDGPALVFWSLSVEEQFYLLWPLAILLLPRPTMIPFVAAVAVGGSIWRALAIWRDPVVGWILTPACANFLALGALVAIADHPVFGSPATARRVRLAFAVAIAGLLGAIGCLVARHGLSDLAHGRLVRILNQIIFSMVFAGVIARTARGLPGWISSALRFPPLTFLGRISYGLYVYHLFVAVAIQRLANHAHLGRALAGNAGVRFLATVAVATASWYLMERPVNDLKRFFPYARPVEPATNRPAHAGTPE
jgi:peptidoglycan/LPS O-acetylase OafA/YrhL